MDGAEAASYPANMYDNGNSERWVKVAIVCFAVVAVGMCAGIIWYLSVHERVAGGV